LDGICFPALLRQIPKMLGLFFVVTFGSCLDVAAIQADMPFPIDFNSELGTG
jgi:SulP family sulfate permease